MKSHNAVNTSYMLAAKIKADSKRSSEGGNANGYYWKSFARQSSDSDPALKGLISMMTLGTPVAANGNTNANDLASFKSYELMAPVQMNKPSLIEKGPLRFVITDAPNDNNVQNLAQELVGLNVKHFCRACEPTYNADVIASAGIQMHEFEFNDGDPPPESVLQPWLQLVHNCFLAHKNPCQPVYYSYKKNKLLKCHGKDVFVERLDSNERLGVHCVAGLGRAPVLVAVALVEFCDMDARDAVDFIREKRRGAINAKQLKWLEHYVPRKQAKIKLATRMRSFLRLKTF